MNIITKILSLEVTELCNLSCKHCLDGKSCKSGNDMLKKILTYDFSKYPYDLSLIDHMES